MTDAPANPASTATPAAADRGVAIVGGGPAGLALAIALHRHGVASEVFDARPKGAAQQDKRTLALAHGTRQSLEWLGVWSGIKHAPIRSIHISQKGGLGITRLAATDYAVPALGYVAQAATLATALSAEAERLQIPVHHDCLVDAAGVRPGADTVEFSAGGQPRQAALLAFAEGAVAPDAPLTQRDYGQSAVICDATLREPHRGNVWERFTQHGPVALLPLDADRRVAVVYTCPPDEAARCREEDPEIEIRLFDVPLADIDTMRADADRFAGQLIAASGQQSPMFFKVKNDPRVTPFGRILRKYSVDELPQLLNVLRGDMSIVGPRPQVRREVESYDELVSRRLTVKPGLTGLWQVSGRSDLRPEDAVRLDLHYVENWSPIQDLVIMAKTVKTVLSTDGAY